MTDLAVTFIAWAQQFASREIAVSVNEDSFDRDYGQYVAIEVAPTVLEKPKIEIMITRQSVGFMVECWQRLSNRVVASNASGPCCDPALDRVAAFLEPGTATLQRTACLLDAIAKGRLEVQARVLRGRLVGSSARIQLESEVVDLQGPATSADMLRLVGMVKTFKLDYCGWAGKMFSLADRIHAI